MPPDPLGEAGLFRPGPPHPGPRLLHPRRLPLPRRLRPFRIRHPAVLAGGDRQLPAAGARRGQAGLAGRRDCPSNATAPASILGVTGTQELVIPLSARLGFPSWRRALQDAGIDAERCEQIIAAHRRFLRLLAGELLPGAAGQRGRRPDQQPPRPERNQLRGGRRLRQLLCRRCTWRCWSSPRAAATWSSPAGSTR
ncbi:MAG: hypothetical protein MZV70_51500 [Desulfobacterales bacterium]|nr:hypothetical protein [Desulfobacterales bacterium]